MRSTLGVSSRLAFAVLWVCSAAEAKPKKKAQHEPVAIVAEEPARVGQRGILGGAVEQPLADALLQAAHRLADSRLSAVELHGCP